MLSITKPNLLAAGAASRHPAAGLCAPVGAQQQQRGRRGVAVQASALGADAHRRRQHFVPRAKPGETAEQALERRLRESERVEERVTYIRSQAQWEQELAKVGGRSGRGGAQRYSPERCLSRKHSPLCLSPPLLHARLRPPAQAGDKLVVLEIQSEELCQTGIEEEAELQWKADKKAAMAPCMCAPGCSGSARSRK